MELLREDRLVSREFPEMELSPAAPQGTAVRWTMDSGYVSAAMTADPYFSECRVVF